MEDVRARWSRSAVGGGEKERRGVSQHLPTTGGLRGPRTTSCSLACLDG